MLVISRAFFHSKYWPKKWYVLGKMQGISEVMGNSLCRELLCEGECFEDFP